MTMIVLILLGRTYIYTHGFLECFGLLLGQALNLSPDTVGISGWRARLRYGTHRNHKSEGVAECYARRLRGVNRPLETQTSSALHASNVYRRIGPRRRPNSIPTTGDASNKTTTATAVKMDSKERFWDTATPRTKEAWHQCNRISVECLSGPLRKRCFVVGFKSRTDPTIDGKFIACLGPADLQATIELLENSMAGCSQFNGTNHSDWQWWSRAERQNCLLVHGHFSALCDGPWNSESASQSFSAKVPPNNLRSAVCISRRRSSRRACARISS